MFLWDCSRLLAFLHHNIPSYLYPFQLLIIYLYITSILVIIFVFCCFLMAQSTEFIVTETRSLSYRAASAKLFFFVIKCLHFLLLHSSVTQQGTLSGNCWGGGGTRHPLPVIAMSHHCSCCLPFLGSGCFGDFLYGSGTCYFDCAVFV